MTQDTEAGAKTRGDGQAPGQKPCSGDRKHSAHNSVFLPCQDGEVRRHQTAVRNENYGLILGERYKHFLLLINLRVLKSQVCAIPVCQLELQPILSQLIKGHGPTHP